MLTETTTLRKADALPVPSTYDGAKAQLKRDARTSKVNTELTTKRMAWVVQVYAVRDNQDRAAFAELFGYFAPRVKSFLMKSGASPDLAEECTQEVMATLWNKAHMFDPTKASVSTWIFTIARNRKIDILRKQRRPEPEDLPWGPESEPDQADAIGLQQETEQLGQALATLPEEQRKLIERAYFGELTHSQIAAETGLPLGTIKSRIRLALDRLRHAMK
ncbi:MAG TPA: sigma-70 family RNA polymerase sigma factor [Yoonia sp.]|nr:sigma-70 family RNA polymerase sigma factor [Yoonia sp.]